MLFAVASYTDHLDGKIARKRNLITNFGKFMDPLADKVMVLSAMVCLVSLDLADVWIVVLMLAREFMVTSIRLVAADRGRVIAANIWGKAKTVSQIIAILAVLLMQYLLELGGMRSFTAAGRKWADHALSQSSATFYWRLPLSSPCCPALCICGATGIFYGKAPEKAFTRNKKGIYCIKRKERLCVGEVSPPKTGRQRRGAMRGSWLEAPWLSGFRGEMHRR